MPEQFGVGEIIEVLNPIDLMPHTVLVPGETGKVVRKIDDMGITAIEVEMDLEHPGLREWCNRALLTFPETTRLRLKRMKQAAVLMFAPLAAACMVKSVAMLALAHHTDTVLRVFT